MNIMLYIAIGLTAGILSGLLGIGGGIILVPALVYLLGLTQHQAQGTTLVLMVPPIGLLAALKYYSQGNVKLAIAVFVCIGFFFGGLVGASFAQKIDDAVLRKVFGLVMLAISVRMVFFK